MPRLRWPEGRKFGMEVLVQATAWRVVGNDEGFSTVIRSKGYRTGKVDAHYAGPHWPGEPVPVTWAPTPRSYPLEPVTTDQAAIRVRRFLHDQPLRGLVIGVTYREEGFVIDQERLAEPGRRITVLEVALVVPSGSARVITAHTNDVQSAPRPRRTNG